MFAGLQVTVNDALLVRRLEGAGDLFFAWRRRGMRAARVYAPDAGDLIWLTFDPGSGVA